MQKAIHPRDDVDRLYVPKKERERGLASIEDNLSSSCIDASTSIQQLEDKIKNHERGLITDIRNDTDNTIDDRITITKKQTWEEKQLYEF